ncbi:MAG: hypothetical protein JW388_0982 [Nitrospira sp.]|nr:hypothetical protein [Nitrospira sp.]
MLKVLEVAENAIINARLAAARVDIANGNTSTRKSLYPCNRAVVEATEPGLDAIRSLRCEMANPTSPMKSVNDAAIALIVAESLLMEAPIRKEEIRDIGNVLDAAHEFVHWFHNKAKDRPMRRKLLRAVGLFGYPTMTAGSWVIVTPATNQPEYIRDGLIFLSQPGHPEILASWNEGYVRK